MTVTAVPSNLATATWIGPKMVELLNCLGNELAMTTSGMTCWHGIAPGADTALAGCASCDEGRCGVSWIRLVSIFQSDTFPSPSEWSKCGTPLAYELEMGVVRCMPLEQDGSDPDPDVMLETTLIQLEDQQAMFKAIQCCLDVKGVLVSIAPYEPQGPDGGCVGGLYGLTIAKD